MAEPADLPVDGEKHGIVYKVAGIGYFDDALKLYREEYRKREPLLIAGGIAQVTECAIKEDMDPLGTTASIRDLLEGGLSLVALDANTDEVVGFRMCQILTKKEREEKLKSTKRMECTEEAERIFRNVDIYESDLLNADIFGSCGVERMVKFVFIVVKESYSRRGIGKELLTRSMNLAKQCGLEAVVVIATNPITVDMFEKLGFEGLRDLTIENYVIDGEKAFPCAFSGQFGRIFVKKL